MGIIDKKKKVFGSIAAMTTLTKGFPKLKSSSSFPSINNNGDAILFLTDLIKSLVGYEEMVMSINDILIYSLNDIEKEIKKALKDELKELVSCGVNPSLPDFIKSTSSGIKLSSRKVDFTDLLFVDPRSVGGQLLYNDIRPNLIDSSDFNTFLYQTVQNNGTIESWGNQTLQSNILNIKFNSTDITGVDPNNTFTLTANAAYDNKKLTDLNNDYIDSINLFNTEKLVSSIVDSTFGTITKVLNTGINALVLQEKLGTVIDKIIHSKDENIDDKVFSFNKEELHASELKAKLKKDGMTILQGSGSIQSRIPVETLTELNNQLSSAVNLEDKKAFLSNGVGLMAGLAAENADTIADISSIKLNFIQEFINKIIRAVITGILSPKVVMIFIVNYKIIYGPTASFDNALDFIKKNKSLMNRIMKRIAGMIIKKLLVIALKKVAELVAESVLKKEVERAKSDVAQILSLVGIPQSQLRLLKGLG